MNNRKSQKEYYGAVETGGTKTIAALCCADGKILEKITVPTVDPKTVLSEIISFFSERPIRSLGVGTFGPVDLNPHSGSYGTILETPKLKWRGYPLYQRLLQSLDVPIVMETDVNAALIGEASFGAATGKSNAVYITVGTGIGAGEMVNGKIVRGSGNTEAGHMFVRIREDDHFPGVCPSHCACLEGLASGPAVEKRWGTAGKDIPEDHPAWDLEAYYLGQAVLNLSMILTPEVVILGGGVMEQKHLFPLIRKYARELNQGYVNLPDLDSYIVPAQLHGDQAILGAFALARSGTITI